MMFRPALIAFALAAALPATAQRGGQYYSAPVTEGFLPFPRLVSIARAAAGGGTFIGNEDREGSPVNRMKFIKDGRVTWVDVDARSGAVLNVEGGR